MALPPEKTIVRHIVALKKQLLDNVHAAMDCVDDRLEALDNKLASGEDLSDDEMRQRKILNDTMETLSANEQRIVLWDLEALDNSAALANLSSAVKQSNQELTQTKQRVEHLIASLNQFGEFLKGATNVLTTLTGLLAALA